MIHLYYTRTAKRFDPKIFEHFLKQLPPGIQSQVLKFRKWEDRQRSIMGKMLFIEGLKFFGYDLKLLDELKYTEFQKPYLDNSLHFNISHSGDYTICVFSQTNKIGVDIEEIKDIPLVDFDNEFSKTELNQIYAAQNPLKLFYTLWTQKEAFLKAIGAGLNVPLNRVAIDKNRITWNKEVWFLKEIKIDPGYISHLSTNDDLLATTIKEVNFTK